ncbi:DUF1573 domain-containing protein [Peijinzhouia sedimentorum]
MKLRKLLKIFYSVSLFVAAFAIVQLLSVNRNDNQINSINGNLEMSSNQHDFGRLKQNISDTFLITLQNPTNEKIIIEEVQAPCSCTNFHLYKYELEPNDESHLMIIYDSKDLGIFNKSIYIVSNTQNSPQQIVITGEVLKELVQ